MKQLTILRHAKSSWDDPQLDDFDRPLNTRGRQAAEAVGGELSRRGVRFDHVVASPAVRVRETLNLLAQGFGSLPPARFERDIYGASVTTLLQQVWALPDAYGSALLAGHNPGLGQLVLALADAASPLRERIADKYPTGAAAVLRFSADRWKDAGDGTIAELILPRELGNA